MIKGILVVPSWEKSRYYQYLKLVKNFDLVKEEKFKIGFSLESGKSIEELIKYEETALRTAKRRGKNTEANVCLLKYRCNSGKLELIASYYS